MRELTRQQKHDIERYFHSTIMRIPKEWKDPEYTYYVEFMRNWTEETMARWEREGI